MPCTQRPLSMTASAAVSEPWSKSAEPWLLVGTVASLGHAPPDTPPAWSTSPRSRSSRSCHLCLPLRSLWQRRHHLYFQRHCCCPCADLQADLPIVCSCRISHAHRHSSHSRKTPYQQLSERNLERCADPGDQTKNPKSRKLKGVFPCEE